MTADVAVWIPYGNTANTGQKRRICACYLQAVECCVAPTSRVCDIRTLSVRSSNKFNTDITSGNRGRKWEICSPTLFQWQNLFIDRAPRWVSLLSRKQPSESQRVIIRQSDYRFLCVSLLPPLRLYVNVAK